MTLQEYLNQKEPVKMPTVELQPGEYTKSAPISNGIETISRVYINGINHEYALINEKGYLFSTDGEGNPVSRSVFYIKN